MSSVCHADRTAAVLRLAKAGVRWSHLQSQVERKFMRPGLVDELSEAEDECIAAAKALAALADCSE